MIVAVLAVRMMQMALDQIVRVVPVANLFVSATRTVDVVGGMGSAPMFGSALVRIRCRYIQRMIVNMIAVHVV